MDQQPDTVVRLAERLADEGVPLRAIARAAGIPSAELREQLAHAKLDGRLLELPREDWPRGFPRDQRALQLSRLMVEDRDALILAIQKAFALTPTQARLLLLMIQNQALCRSRLDLPALSVHVHQLRQRLAPFGLKIQTLWAHGYEIPAGDRHKAMDVILQRIETAHRLIGT